MILVFRAVVASQLRLWFADQKVTQMSGVMHTVKHSSAVLGNTGALGTLLDQSN